MTNVRNAGCNHSGRGSSRLMRISDSLLERLAKRDSSLPSSSEAIRFSSTVEEVYQPSPGLAGDVRVQFGAAAAETICGGEGSDTTAAEAAGGGGGGAGGGRGRR